jgi:hypothetical protein
VERIPADTWAQYPGHVERYAWAARLTRDGEVVNDIACGVGYAAPLFARAGSYRGYDKPGVPGKRFGDCFAEADLDDPAWVPRDCDVTCCFETLEHVKDPGHLASVIAATTKRAVFVSVPVIPTTHCNPWHRTDFTREDIPPLFGGFVIEQEWAQPEETSHVWMFTRA